MSQLASPRQLRMSLLRWVLVCVPGVLMLGFLASQLANSGPDNPWFAALVKPELYPPPATFGIVWSILYALIGFALAMVASARGAEGRGLAVFVFMFQLGLNIAWSPVFFGMHRIQAALILLALIDVAVMITIVLFLRIRRTAGLLLLPYLAWVLFATYLTWDIQRLNPGADGREVSGAVERFEI